jgi:hypothetical protein
MLENHHSCNFFSHIYIRTTITKFVVIVVIIVIIVIITTSDAGGSQKVKLCVLYFVLFTRWACVNFTELHYNLAQGMAIF